MDAEAGEWPPRVLKVGASGLGAIANECLGHVKTRAKVSAVVPKLEALLARHTCATPSFKRPKLQAVATA